MSDWEIIQDNSTQKQPSSSDWEMVNTANQQPQESIGTSLLYAIPRIGVDVAKGGYEAAKKIPGYYESAKTEVPGIFSAFKNDPNHAMGQGYAGVAELGKNVFNTPHDVINYLSNRLHLVPEDINKIVQMGRMPEEETQNAINQKFGEPIQPGEALFRGLNRNALNLAGGAGIAKTLNPLQFTNGAISKSVINELNKQVEKHTGMYNDLWKEAQSKGFNQVPFDRNLINSNFSEIKKYYTPKQYKTVENFINNPTLENAQRAQSDLGVLRRSIQEKARKMPLLGAERDLYDALTNAEKHIEGNMFKDASGKINQKLFDKYNKITNSYRENVVPYKYNSAIQAFLSNKITKKQLFQRLNTGEFAAKKGSEHPAFGIRNSLLPIFGTALTGAGAIGGSKYLYDQALGNPLAKQ
jgi:hypothetical protein